MPPRAAFPRAKFRATPGVAGCRTWTPKAECGAPWLVTIRTNEPRSFVGAAGATAIDAEHAHEVDELVQRG